MKEAIKLSIISLVSIIVITFPFIGFLSILLSIVYYLFIILPFLPLIANMDIGLIEKFALVNFSGLSYSTFTLLLDSVLKIKLTKLVFIIIPIIIFMIGLKYKDKGVNK